MDLRVPNKDIIYPAGGAEMSRGGLGWLRIRPGSAESGVEVGKRKLLWKV